MQCGELAAVLIAKLYKHIFIIWTIMIVCYIIVDGTISSNSSRNCSSIKRCSFNYYLRILIKSKQTQTH